MKYALFSFSFTFAVYHKIRTPPFFALKVVNKFIFMLREEL
jgi:hypothetical protein